MAMDNPYEAPLAGVSAPTRARALDREYGGIGRLAYFGYSFLVGIVAMILIMVLATALPENPEAAVLLVQVVQIVAGLYLACMRAKNLGSNPWWGLTILIPLYNILVGIRLIAYPPGWTDHRQLDTPGKVIVGIILGFFAVIVLLIILALVAGA